MNTWEERAREERYKDRERGVIERRGGKDTKSGAKGTER
jgi:hypothetical protein